MEKINLDKLMSKHHFKRFSKDSRSTFSYWYYHWKAFLLVSYYLHRFNIKYLLHDIEKPFLKVWWGDYKKVHDWHRLHNAHHTEYKKGLKYIDWLALVIDNECSRFSKMNAEKTAREWANYVIYEKNTSQEIKDAYIENVLPLLDELGL